MIWKTSLYLGSKVLNPQNGKISHPLVALEKLYHILKNCKGKKKRLEGESGRSLSYFLLVFHLWRKR